MPFGKITDLMVHDGLWEIFNGYHMGFTAENIAAKFQRFKGKAGSSAYESDPARAANASGAVADEIVPVVIPQRKAIPRSSRWTSGPWTRASKMAKLPRLRQPERPTPGNASGINDSPARWSS